MSILISQLIPQSPRKALKQWIPNFLFFRLFTLFYLEPQGTFNYVDYTYLNLFCYCIKSWEI